MGDAPLYIYCSPYTRTKQTLARIVECLDGNTIVGVREEPRLTEQVWGFLYVCWVVLVCVGWVGWGMGGLVYWWMDRLIDRPDEH